MVLKGDGEKKIEELAYFGGSPIFLEPKSTSCLAQPDFESFLNYSKQFFDLRYYSNNGVLVKQLEERLAGVPDAKFCVTFCSGFWALVLTISTLSLKGKTEIVMPSLTYRRMADIAAWAKLKPRFCEVNTNTLALDSQTASECINNETALILAVHPIVNCCEVGGILSLGADKDIPVLFDSVESMFESSANGKIGSFGDAECFSMHASKLLNGFEGGYVTTNNHKLARKLSLLRSFGFEGQDNCVVPGALNAKLNEIHAAMALANLDELDKVVTANLRNYRCYQSGLKSIRGIQLLDFDESYNTSYKNIVVEVLDEWPLSRDLTIEILNAENILARAYYSTPLHSKKMSYPHIPTTLKITDTLAKKFMLLPCGEFVRCDDIKKIVRFLGFISSHSIELSMYLTKKNSYE